MIIIGGEPSPVERVRLGTDDINSISYFAKNVISATLDPAGEIRIPDFIDWPFPNVTPEDARGWWVYNATWDPRYVDIDYANRKIKLKRVGKTEIQYRIENADGTGIDLTWSLDILDRLTPLSVTINPSFNTSANYHTPFVITANVDGGDYPYTFRWYRGGQVIRTRSTDPNDPTDKMDRIDIPSLEWVDENTYRVDASDRHGTLVSSVTFRLTIIADPIVFAGQDELFRVKQGGTWSDRFNFTGGKPPYEYNWLHDGVPTLYTAQPITITNIQPSDAGGYQLSVTDALNVNAVSPYTYTVYVMEYAIKASARNTWTQAASTITNNGSMIGVKLDLNDTREISYALNGVRFDNGANVAIGPWTVDGVDPEFTVGTGGADNILKLTPKALGSASAVIYTDDNRSDALTINATVIALPHIDSSVTAPPIVLVTGQSPSPSYTMTPTVRASVVAETYRWERQYPGGSWTNVGSGKTLTIQPLASAAQDGTLYRFTITNQYGTAVSNTYTQLFYTFDGANVVRADAYPTDGMMPGGKYTFNISSPNSYVSRSIALANTSATFDVTGTDTGLTVTQLSKTSVRIDVDKTAPAEAHAVTVSLINTDSDPDAQRVSTFNTRVVVPVINEVTKTAVKDNEVLMATLTLTPAFLRASAQTRAGVITNPPGQVITRWDAATASIYVTGIDVADSIDAVIRVYYYAPGNADEQFLEFPYDIETREMLTFQSGISTSGDNLTAFVDSQNKTK